MNWILGDYEIIVWQEWVIKLKNNYTQLYIKQEDFEDLFNNLYNGDFHTMCS